jgi:hypothetical protein
VSQCSSKTGFAAVIVAFSWTFFTVALPTSCLPAFTRFKAAAPILQLSDLLPLYQLQGTLCWLQK